MALSSHHLLGKSFHNFRTSQIQLCLHPNKVDDSNVDTLPDATSYRAHQASNLGSITEAAVKEQFACPNCGAGMQFSPESSQLKCAHCGQTQAMIAGSTVTAHDFNGAVAGHQLQPITANALHVTCTGCGSVVACEPPEVAGTCSFCGTAIVAQPKAADPLIAPDVVLPVKLPKQGALTRLQQWLSSRWFAPNALKRLARPDGINGVYLPLWSYYFHTASDSSR